MNWVFTGYQRINRVKEDVFDSCGVHLYRDIDVIDGNYEKFYLNTYLISRLCPK